MINEEQVVELFIELVKIDSVSRQERLMVDKLKDILIKLGGEFVEDKTGEKINGNAGNIIADFKGSKDEYPYLLLSAHLDRVEPGRGVKPVIKDDYITSSGDTVLGGDDIIGVTAILESIRLIKEQELAHGPIRVIFSVAEEVGLLGAKNLEDKYLTDIDYGIVYDVDGEIGTIVYKAPTQIKFNALIKGKAAHAGICPEEGINAIKIASKAISDMKLGQIDNETTANIGVIRGGRASNIVPALVELEGEVRSHNNDKVINQSKHMQDVINKAVNKYNGQVKYDIEKMYTNFEIDHESDIIKIIEKSVKDLKLNPIYQISGGGSDANIFNNRGLPVVNIGVGMEKVHSTEERVKIINIIKLIELTIRILNNSRDFK